MSGHVSGGESGESGTSVIETECNMQYRRFDVQRVLFVNGQLLRF